MSWQPVSFTSGPSPPSPSIPPSGSQVNHGGKRRASVFLLGLSKRIRQRNNLTCYDQSNSSVFSWQDIAISDWLSFLLPPLALFHLNREWLMGLWLISHLPQESFCLLWVPFSVKRRKRPHSWVSFSSPSCCFWKSPDCLSGTGAGRCFICFVEAFSQGWGSWGNLHETRVKRKRSKY